MQRSVGAVCLLSVNPRTDVNPKEQTSSDLDRSSSSEDSLISDSDESLDLDLRTPDDQEPITVKHTVSACATCVDLKTLAMSVTPDKMGPVLECETRRPLSFKAIVHLHLSFLIDVPVAMVQAASTDSSQRESRSSKRQAGIVRTPSRVIRAFSRRSRSCDDEEALNACRSAIQTLRLRKLQFVVNYLRYEEERLRTKGLFRISGNANRVRDLTHRLLEEEPDTPLCLDGFQVHDIASALKGSLAGLQPGIIPSDLHSLFAQVIRLTAPRTDDNGVVIPFAPGDLELFRTKQQKALRLLMLLIDRPCRVFLMDLLDCLKAVSQREAVTYISDNALGILFGPVLFRIQGEVTAKEVLIFNETVELMLSWYPSIFEVPICVLEPMTRALESPDNDLEHASSVSYVQRDSKSKTPITEYALSELYAHIASMPDSAKKRRFIKQVSNRNGGIVSPNSPSVSHVERAHATARQTQCL